MITIIGLIHVFEVVNIRRGPKNDLTPECEENHSWFSRFDLLLTIFDIKRTFVELFCTYIDLI